jgi:hypothetical protein
MIVETYPRITNGHCSNNHVYGRYLCDCHKLTWPSNKVVLRGFVAEISMQNQRGCRAEDLCRILKNICINMSSSPNISVFLLFYRFLKIKHLLLILACCIPLRYIHNKMNKYSVSHNTYIYGHLINVVCLCPPILAIIGTFKQK